MIFTCLTHNISPERKPILVSWLVDSGYSTQVTFDRPFSFTFGDIKSGSVTMGTKSEPSGAVSGDVHVMLNTNDLHVLQS